MKIFRGLVFLLWFFVAFAYGQYDYFKIKQGCIEREGFLKGWLWCSEENTGTYVRSLLRGMVWPYFLFNYLAASSEEEQDGSLADDMPHTQMAYICWATAFKLDKGQDATDLASAIKFMRSGSKMLDENHQKFVGEAAKELLKIESVGSLNEFYQSNCSAPVSNIRNMISQGMLK